jgi:ribonuclease T2
MRLRIPILLATMLLTACAKKDGPACEIPANLPRPMLEGPTAREPRRLLPIGGYTLAVSWTPEYCVDRRSSPQDRIRCGAEKPFGFTLHGLWPDGEGALWPQYCTPTRLVPEPVIRQHLCSTPSPQLIQHEWEKHGTCMAKTPADYFAKSGELFDALRFPDMANHSGRTMRAADFQKAFADANPGMAPDQMRLNIDKSGWLEEVWICLDKSFRHRACPAHQGGAEPDRVIRIR